MTLHEQIAATMRMAEAERSQAELAALKAQKHLDNAEVLGHLVTTLRAQAQRQQEAS